MKKIRNIIIMIILIAAIAVLFTACGSSDSTIPQPTPDEGAKVYEISGTCEIEKISDAEITVHCEANIMKDAVIMVSIDNYDGKNVAEYKWTKTDDDTCDVSFTITDDWTDPVYASIVCTPSSNGSQPKTVKDAYGNQFQNISGDCVIWNTEGNAVVIQSEPFSDF